MVREYPVKVICSYGFDPMNLLRRGGTRLNATDVRREALSAALRQGRLKPVFQPIFTVVGELLGFEALTRFSNGCPPNLVWQAAEELNLVDRLEHLALTLAVQAAKDLPGKLFLNISAQHLDQAESLAQFGHPERIVWEVTETAVRTRAGRAGVAWLKGQQYVLAMDDAGAGWSTRYRLQWLRPAIVKLDYSIVRAFCGGQNDALLAWVEAAQQVGARVLAEGVEDRAWINRLEKAGVEWVQGFALGRPEPVTVWRGSLA